MAELRLEMEDNSAPIMENTLRLITYASWFLGVGVARPPMTWSKFVTIILRFIHFIMIVVIATYSVVDFLRFGNVFKSNIFTFMYCTNKMIGCILSCYYVYHGNGCNDKWSQLMREMNSVVREIRTRILPMNDRPLKIIQILAILATIVCGPLFLIVHLLYYYYYTRSKDIFISDLLQYYTTTQFLMNGFMFIVVVYVLYCMLKTIKKFIGQLDRQDAPGTELEIRDIRELYIGIYYEGELVNKIYGPNLLLSSAYCFTMITTTLFRIYMDIAENNDGFMLTNTILCIVYAVSFGLMCWVCTLATKEYLNQNWNRIGNELNNFSMQQYRLNFSACQLFEINNSLFFAFVGLITTFVTFCIKFYELEYQNMASVISEQNDNKTKS